MLLSTSQPSDNTTANLGTNIIHHLSHHQYQQHNHQISEKTYICIKVSNDKGTHDDMIDDMPFNWKMHYFPCVGIVR